MNRHVLPTLLIASFLGGCCNCLKPTPPDLRPLPAPISKEEQLDNLNRRATELPRLSASGGVEIWFMQDGKQKHKSADGDLKLQQEYATHSADVYVRAKVLGQNAFEAGKNEKEWWFHDYSEKQEGVVGDVTGAPALTAEAGSIFRADFIPELLAITEITPTAGETILMRVDDLHGTNDLLIERLAENGSAQIERQLIIDRRSGEVREVAMYGPEGVLVVHAQLENYEPVTYSGGATATEGQVPTMPRHIVIEYPAAHATVGLSLGRTDVPARIKGTPFETPDWNDLGIKPRHAE